MAAVSVIMPAYNVAPYIGEAIRSVVAQTMPDWELLITDDGSTDGTAAAVRAAAGGEPRVRLIEGPNEGVSAARNTAFAQATGEFIALLDGDDIWDPTFLETQLAILAANPEIDVITGNGWLLGGPHSGQPARPFPDPRPEPTFATILADENAVFIMSVMRRRVFAEIGGFDASLRTNEDYEFWLRAAHAGFRFHRNDRPLGQYRRRSDSASANDLRMLTGILVVFEKMRKLSTGRPEELRIIDEQLARFSRDQIAARMRAAIADGDVRAAAGHLAALHAHSGGATLKVASVLARLAPSLFFRAYRFSRSRQAAAS
jgi:glycosyltransferase involved in cell wall biosynthesis